MTVGVFVVKSLIVELVPVPLHMLVILVYVVVCCVMVFVMVVVMHVSVLVGPTDEVVVGCGDTVAILSKGGKERERHKRQVKFIFLKPYVMRLCSCALNSVNKCVSVTTALHVCMCVLAFDLTITSK